MIINENTSFLLNFIIQFFILYILMFGIMFLMRYIKLQKDKNEQNQVVFTRDEVDKIKTKIKSFAETKKNEIFIRNIKENLSRNYDNDLLNDFYEIMNDMDMLCEGVIKGIYSEKYVKIYLKNILKEYYNNANTINSISSQEMFISIGLLLDKWSKEDKGVRK